MGGKPGRTGRWYTGLPVVGGLLRDLLDPDGAPYRRYLEREDRARRIRAQLFSLLAILSGLLYLAWIAAAINPEHRWIGGAFVFAELMCFSLFFLATVNLWRLRFKPRDPPEPARAYSVDVFVLVCGEPLNVVEKTLRAVARIEWEGTLGVLVLDDGASDPVRYLAESLGFRYRSRPRVGLERSNAKAGNLNFGLAHSSSELVLVLDADQVPRREIVRVLAGYMHFPRVAFVQSRQSFLVADGDPFYNEDRVFYGAVQLGLDDQDTVISCGSGVLYRRAALDDVGGFATWNLVEDLTTSYELHAHGWKSFYYPYPLAEGMAPQDIWGVYKQRGQWALDTMRLFFWDNPLLKRGLAWRKRLGYLLIGLTYLCSGFVIPLFFLIPPWSYLTGGRILVRPELEFAAVRVLYFSAMAVAIRYLARGENPGKQFQILVGLFPIYALNTLRALRYRTSKPQYHVNNRAADGPPRPRPPLLAVLPQLAILAANLLLPYYAISAETAPGRMIAANALVSALAVWTLWPAIAAALGDHTWSAERHPLQFYGSLEAR